MHSLEDYNNDIIALREYEKGGHNYFELIYILFSPLFIASWSWMGVYKILCKTLDDNIIINFVQFLQST